MSKGLKALEKIHDHWNCCSPKNNGCDEKDFDIIDIELKVLEIIKQKGIAFLVPNNEYSNERIHIELYTNTLSEKELKMIKEILGL